MNSRLRRATGCAVATVAACALTTVVGPPSATAAATPKVSYSDRNVVAGADVRAVVDKSTRPRGTRLVLQRKHLDGWRAVDKKARETRRGFVLDLPTDQFGAFSYRVVAKDDGGRIVSRSDQDTVTVRPPYEPLGRNRQHVFGSSPRVRWDSCRTIQWTFNPQKAPPRAFRQLREGFRRIRLATGLEFDFAGKTDQKVNPYGTGLGKPDVIVGWRTAKDYAPFRRYPDTVGMGGNTYYSGYQEADGTKVYRAVKGGVVFNASMRDELSNGFGKGTTWGEVIIHELGHVVGLAHPRSEKQIMFSLMRRRNADWGAGDLAGFRRLGDVRGCVERVPARHHDDRRVGRFVLH